MATTELTPIAYAGTRRGLVMLKYRCSCGVEKVFPRTVVSNNKTLTCGHSRTAWQQSGLANKTHGDSNSAEYLAWQNAKGRCYNVENPRYHRYGARGITMCAEWLNSYAAFLSDMGRRPSAGHSLERKDNNKGYCKSNCIWATAKEQAQNKEYV